MPLAWRHSPFFGLTLLLLGVVALALSPGAHAAGGGSKADSHGEELVVQEGEEESYPETSSAMPMLLVPAKVDGKKSHYIFVSYRIVVETQLQVDRVNQKAAWLHDAFMREVFKTSPTLKGNPNRVDRERLLTRFKEISAGILGDDIVTDLYFHSEMSEKDPRPASGPVVPKKPKSSEGH